MSEIEESRRSWHLRAGKLHVNSNAESDSIAPTARYDDSDSRRVGFYICGSLAIVLGLHFLGRLGYYEGLYSFFVADTITLCSLVVLGASATVILHATYGTRSVTRIALLGSSLIVLGQVINLIDSVPAFGGAPLSMVRSFAVFKEPVSATGIVLFLASLYWSVYEAHKSKRQVQIERGRLQERVEERTAELAKANTDLAAEIMERKRVEESLRESVEKWKNLFSILPVGVSVIDAQGCVADSNPTLKEILGVSSGGVSRELFRDLTYFVANGEKMPHEEFPSNRAVRERRTVRDVETGILKQDGEILWTSVSAAPLSLPEAGTVVTIADISERRLAEQERLRLEAQVQHSQKLESLGLLAGGIAHDFNNILHLILGNLELAKELIPQQPQALAMMDKIEMSARRAVTLTHQMLAYSGKGHFLIQPLDMGETVKEIANLVQASMSKKVALHLDLETGLPAIHADAAQIQQVAMNLMVNAAEALDEEAGGSILVSTRLVHCSGEYLAENRLFEAPAEGDYVCLEVTDTGCGMDEKTKERLFDPFFSTKFTGRGLGMSAVLGIVRGHKGAIMVESALEQGTRIRVLFPATDERAPLRTSKSGVTQSSAVVPDTTILFVDDEPDMLDLAAATLEQLGYAVLTAADGVDALEVFKKNADNVDCVLLDLSMPRMDGVETFLELRRLQPDCRIILASGYSEQELRARFVGHSVEAFIEKPYDVRTLSDTLQEVLGRSPMPPEVSSDGEERKSMAST